MSELITPEQEIWVIQRYNRYIREHMAKVAKLIGLEQTPSPTWARYLREREHAGVLAVGRVRRRAEQRRKARRKAVAQQCPVQAGVLYIIPLAGRADGAHVAYVLHHGGERYRDYRHREYGQRRCE